MRPSALELMLRRTRRRLAWARSGDALFVSLAAMGVAGTAVIVFGLAWTWPLLAGVAGFAAVWRPTPSLLGTANWLDRRYGLDDLLASAWSIRGHDGPWATTLRAMADARAAALPPAGGSARFSARHHACVIAAAVALALTGRVLVPTSGHARPSDADDAVAVAAEATPPAPPRQVAAESRRAGETAESRMNFPSPALAANPNDSTANASPRPGRQTADAADGAGRADAEKVIAPKPTSPPASDLAATPPGPSGFGPAAPHDDNNRDGRGPVGGRVAGETHAPAAPPSPAPPSAAPSAVDLAPDRPPADRTPASPVPAAYRDLVRDYFAR